MNKASGGDGIPDELFQILNDDTVKVLHLICQQIQKTQQWPQTERSVFTPTPKHGNECSNYYIISLISNASMKILMKILGIYILISGRGIVSQWTITFMVKFERVTGRKARGPQTEEISCKGQTFFISLISGRRKQTTSVRFFFPVVCKIKKRFLSKFCVDMMTPGSTFSQTLS